MPLYLQIDNLVITGTLNSPRPPVPPKGRRFIEMDEDAEAPEPLSTVTIKGDQGDPIVKFVPGSVTFAPPVPAPPQPTVADKLEEILTEVKKIARP